MESQANKAIVIIDDMFPRLREKDGFSGRKHAEYIGLMSRLDNSIALCPATQRFTMDDHKKAVGCLKRLTGLEQGRFWYSSPPVSVYGGLAYIVFPHKALRYLPYIEAAGLRFVVTVYPGGGFLISGPQEQKSLARLIKLATHPNFHGFIVHHDIIREYLVRHLPKAPLHVFDGGFSQIPPTSHKGKTYFGEHRNILNLCFMANRYDPFGLGKGFDIFLEAARQAQTLFPNASFHVVGDWPQDETAGVRKNDPVNFHGYIVATGLPTFFKDMDIIVSPTRADIPVPGKFDGFPLVIDASSCGVAICASDPLSQNRHYRDGEDLWIIRPDVAEVLNIINHVITNSHVLRHVAENGMRITQRTRNYEDKMDQKSELLRRLVE